jgi:anthranilate synthase/aminodeoxychorismate synthase-like glutamine amidotransferase
LVLLIDNYDSFTYNLYDYICRAGKECKVVRNDAITLEELQKIPFTSAIISPGPCRPDSAGITQAFIAHYYNKLPILGICLGHQALGEFFGAELVKAIKPMHGKTSDVKIAQHPVFNKLPNTISVMRYHSLVLKNVVAPLRVIAKTKKGEIMAVAHETLPLVGIQFHPESILTPNGLQIIQNWFDCIEASSC